MTGLWYNLNIGRELIVHKQIREIYDKKPVSIANHAPHLNGTAVQPVKNAIIIIGDLKIESLLELVVTYMLKIIKIK